MKKRTIDELKSIIASELGYSSGSLPDKWKEFILNLHENTGTGVEVVVLSMLSYFTGKNKKYFSPKKGFNLCNSPINMNYNEKEFILYGGIGYFRDFPLNTDYVSQLLYNEKNGTANQIIRVENINGSFIITESPVKPVYETQNLLYFSRFMQYDTPERYYEKENKTITYNAPHFNTLLQNLFTTLKYTPKIPIERVGALEFIIPDFNTKLFLLNTTTNHNRVNIDLNKTYTRKSTESSVEDYKEHIKEFCSLVHDLLDI